MLVSYTKLPVGTTLAYFVEDRRDDFLDQFAGGKQRCGARKFLVCGDNIHRSNRLDEALAHSPVGVCCLDRRLRVGDQVIQLGFRKLVLPG